MPPIPVHIDEPITPSKAQEKPSTEPTRTTNPHASITSAAVAGGPPPAFPAVPVAQPALPGPTPFAAAPPPPPTRTAQATQNASPPPPQPGAVPTAPIQHQAPVTPSKPLPSAQTMTTPAAAANTPSASSAQPTHNLSTSHPTGYQQNLFAQELSPAQRASLDQQEEVDRRGSLFAGLPGGTNASGNAGGAGGGGMLGDDASQTAGNVWSAVKGWASAAGNKAVELEAETWKRFGPGKS